MVGSGEISLGGSSSGASRIFFCSTARPTLLLVVAILSYANVVQGWLGFTKSQNRFESELTRKFSCNKEGRSISLGRWDW